MLHETNKCKGTAVNTHARTQPAAVKLMTMIYCLLYIDADDDAHAVADALYNVEVKSGRL